MPKQPALSAGKKAGKDLSPQEIAQLKALRKAQRDASQRVEALKLKLFQITEHHMDQAISLIRRWIQN